MVPEVPMIRPLTAAMTTATVSVAISTDPARARRPTVRRLTPTRVFVVVRADAPDDEPRD